MIVIWGVVIKMEKDWKYGHKCLAGDKHRETSDETYGADKMIIYCSKCSEYLFTRRP